LHEEARKAHNERGGATAPLVLPGSKLLGNPNTGEEKAKAGEWGLKAETAKGRNSGSASTAPRDVEDTDVIFGDR
jgi:hypothetical protein